MSILDRTNQLSQSAPLRQDGCRRCGGLMVPEVLPELNLKRFEVPAERCVLCGEIVDSVILKVRVPRRPRLRTRTWCSFPRESSRWEAMSIADETKHQVVLDPYWIDKYETSNASYRGFMKATSHAAPAYWDDPRLSKATQPVVGVSWTDANAFCKWEGKRLPTEAEWERGAKGPDGDRHYPWGHSIDSSKANYGQNVGRTAPADSYPEGMSGYGVYNMAGNVFEWVDDWYDPTYYKGSIALNPKGADQGYKILPIKDQSKSFGEAPLTV